MPLKRRRLRRSDRFDWENLDGNDRFCLTWGRLRHRGAIFRSLAELREAYWLNRDRLLSIRGLSDLSPNECCQSEPGTRPRCYWRFEATERPKFIGWRTLRWKPWEVTQWLRENRGAEVGGRKGRRRVYECQEDTLRRLGEIGPDEERLLDAIKRKEAQHVRKVGAECRCSICAIHRTYPHRLAPFLPAVQVGLPTDSEEE